MITLPKLNDLGGAGGEGIIKTNSPDQRAIREAEKCCKKSRLSEQFNKANTKHVPQQVSGPSGVPMGDGHSGSCRVGVRSGGWTPGPGGVSLWTFPKRKPTKRRKEKSSCSCP